MATAETSIDVSTLVTVGPFYSSTEGGGSSSEAAADCGYDGGESTSIVGLVTTMTGIVEASSGGPEGILIIFKDTMPYHRVDNRATRLYARIKRKKPASAFPVLIAENERVFSQFQTTLGTERSKILETLDVLEQLICAGDYES